METSAVANENTPLTEFEKNNLAALKKYDIFLDGLQSVTSLSGIKDCLIEYAVEEVTEIPELPNPDTWPRQQVLIGFINNPQSLSDFDGQQSLAEAVYALNNLEAALQGAEKPSYQDIQKLINQFQLEPVRNRIHELLYPAQPVEIDD